MNIDSINLTIELSHFCNFHCSYCSQGLNHSNKELMNFNTFKMNLLLFKRECLSKNIKKFFIIIQGGELSVFGKDILPYFEYINDIFQDLSTRLVFPTNFSGKLRLYEDIVDIFRNSKILFIINISLHDELLLLNYKKRLNHIHDYVELCNTQSVVIEISVLKLPDMSIYDDFIDFIKSEEMLFYYDELDENDSGPMNLLYCTLDLLGFKDNIKNNQLQTKPFRILNTEISDEFSHHVEIENKREISYANEIELFKSTR